MNYRDYINTAKVLCLGTPLNIMSPQAERFEFCQANDGQFFVAKYKHFCERADAEIIYLSEEGAKEFVRRFAPKTIYKKIFNS
ncbi:MAG: hypothetical protein MJ168_12950 [Clostridia bacterium]|nr:hypothetical protein [Clostridia bacterium]